MKRDYSKFFTPPDIARFMVNLLNPKGGEIILEPSAGDGSLVRAIKEKCVSCIVIAIEITKGYKPYLRNAGANIVLVEDFLTHDGYATISSCIANPPFGNENDVYAHYKAIRAHVKVGGKVVMIVPRDFKPDAHERVEHNIDNWATNSDGSTTEIKIIEFIN